MHFSLLETELQSPRQARKKEKNNNLQKLGYMMMMAPLVMQVICCLFIFSAREMMKFIIM